MEMVTFFFIVNTGVAVLCAFFYYVLYMCTFNTELLFEVHIHGLSGYLAGDNITEDIVFITINVYIHFRCEYSSEASDARSYSGQNSSG